MGVHEQNHTRQFCLDEREGVLGTHWHRPGMERRQRFPDETRILPPGGIILCVFLMLHPLEFLICTSPMIHLEEVMGRFLCLEDAQVSRLDFCQHKVGKSDGF